MTLRPALLAAAALATALGTCLALGRWGAGSNRDLAAVTREFRRGDELESQAEASRRRFEAKWDLATKGHGRPDDPAGGGRALPPPG
jgi:hypothetical protein